MRETHPEVFCERCGRENVTWFAPSDLWNRAARTSETDPMLCPVCFIRAAEQLGIGLDGAWRVQPEFYVAPVPTTPLAPAGGTPLCHKCDGEMHEVVSALRPYDVVGLTCSNAECDDFLRNFPPMAPAASTPSKGPALRVRVSPLTSPLDTLQARLDYIAARYVGGDFESETYPDAVVLHLALPKDSLIGADFIATIDRAMSAHPTEGA